MDAYRRAKLLRSALIPPGANHVRLSNAARNFMRSPYTYKTSQIFGLHSFGGYLEATPPGWSEGQPPITPAEAQRLFDEELLQIDDTMTHEVNDPGVIAMRVQASMVFRVRCEAYFQYLTTAGDFGAMPTTRDVQIASTTAGNPQDWYEQVVVTAHQDPTNVSAPGEPGTATLAGWPRLQEGAAVPRYQPSPHLQLVQPMMPAAASRALKAPVGHPSPHQPFTVPSQVIQPMAITLTPPSPPLSAAASAPCDAPPPISGLLTVPGSSPTPRKRQRTWYGEELEDMTLPTSSNMTGMASSAARMGAGVGSSLEKNGRKKRKAAGKSS